MKTTSKILVASALLMALLPSCKKNSSSSETTTLSTPPYQVGQPISPGNLTAGSYKGTMTSGNTYTLTGDFTVNIGDTVFLQPGVTVCVKPGVTIIVKGTFISLGTQSQQNYIEACGIAQVDQIGNSINTDPAWNNGLGTWTGINCDTSCKCLDLQWTHIQYCGAAFSTTEPFVGGTSGSTSYAILFQNPNGDCIMTDSWIYGTIDDAIRFAGGRIYMARNTLEKMGYLGGDGLNAKNGTQGDMCYNLCIGNATNSTKCSNKGGSFTECNINMYNNTYVDCGYRQASPASRGSDIDIEQSGEGLIYNNLVVNCRNGIRVSDGQNSIPFPDTIHTTCGYNYIYSDSIQECDQFYPTTAGTWDPITTYVIPTAAQYPLPADFRDVTSNLNQDDLYVPAPAGTALENNPMFVNFPLPEHLNASSGQSFTSIASVETGVADVGSPYNFRLKAGSPAIGMGYTGFTPFKNILNPITSDPVGQNSHFAPAISQPGIDIGAYQSNGTGNQH